MKRETLEMLMLPELYDLLVENTILLLDSIEKKSDGVTIRDLQKKVGVIQEIIRKNERRRRLNLFCLLVEFAVPASSGPPAQWRLQLLI
jgi:hypothetical protein